MKLKLNKHKFWLYSNHFSHVEVFDSVIEEWGRQENLDLKKEENICDYLRTDLINEGEPPYTYNEFYINLNKEELVTFLLKYGDLFANRNLQELPNKGFQ